jgi:hypothetical protein
VSPLAGFEVTTYGRIWGDRRGVGRSRSCQLTGRSHPQQAESLPFSLGHDRDNFQIEFVSVSNCLKPAFENFRPASLHNDQLGTVEPHRDFHRFTGVLDRAFPSNCVAFNLRFPIALNMGDLKCAAFCRQNPGRTESLGLSSFPSPDQFRAFGIIGSQRYGTQHKKQASD